MFKGQPLVLSWFKSSAKPTASLSGELLTGSDVIVGEEDGDDDVLEVGGEDPDVSRYT